MDKKAKKGKNFGMWAGFAVFLVALVALAIYFVPQNIGNGDDGMNIPLGQCDSTTTPSLTISSYDTDNVGTALTETTNLYRIKGQNAWSTFTAGTAFDVEALQTYEFVMGISTTDWTDNAYGDKFEYTIPCKETVSIERAVANDEVETSLTATFYNADDNAAAETFSAGETQVLELRLKAGTDEYFGNPFYGSNPNVIVFEINSTHGDKPESVNIKGGADLKEVTVPGRQSLSSGNNYYAYELPVVGDKDVIVEFAYNADDSNAPAADDTAYMYAGNWYINAETGDAEFGVENEEDTAVGTDAADSVTIDLTA